MILLAFNHSCPVHAPFLRFYLHLRTVCAVLRKNKTDCFGSPFFLLVRIVWMRTNVQAVGKLTRNRLCDHRERSAACTPSGARVGSDSFGARAAVSTIEKGRHQPSFFHSRSSAIPIPKPFHSSDSPPERAVLPDTPTDMEFFSVLPSKNTHTRHFLCKNQGTFPQFSQKISPQPVEIFVDICPQKREKSCEKRRIWDFNRVKQGFLVVEKWKTG